MLTYALSLERSRIAATTQISLCSQMQLLRADDLSPSALGALYFECYGRTIVPSLDAARQEMARSLAGAYGAVAPYLTWGLTRSNGVNLVGAIITVERAPWADTPEGPFITDYMITPAFRRRGLGAFLMGRVIASAAASGERFLGLRVASHNWPALSLYRSFGFSPWAA